MVKRSDLKLYYRNKTSKVLDYYLSLPKLMQENLKFNNC